MGALTSNRKRAEEISNLNITNPYSHSLKRPRFSFTSMKESLERPDIVSSTNTVSRLARYPEAQSKLRREVHAPCRIVKFGSWKDKNKGFGERGGSVDAMGNALSRQYFKARNLAFDTLRYWTKGKEVIVVDDEPDEKTETVNVEEQDLSIDEIVNVEDDGREGQSVVSEERRLGDGNGAALDAKALATSWVSNLTDDSVRVDSAGKMLDSLSLDRRVESADAYKKLLEDVSRRDFKLNDLKFQIELNEKKRSLYSLCPTKQPKEEVPIEPFIPLTNEDEAFIKRAFSANRRRILVTHENSNIEITGEVLQCLRPGAWLNDEVINVYLELLKERERREPKKFLKCHFFNTFFYKKLTGGRGGYDYKSVSRWTSQRKLGYGLIECDKIFVPIHLEIHWCLAVINRKDKKFQYLDSLRGRSTQVMKVLARYFVDEVKDKSGKDIDVSSWEHEYVENLPAQENGYDCGMFMIKYADFYSRGLGLCFNQEHMPYFRLRTAKEILKLRAD